MTMVASLTLSVLVLLLIMNLVPHVAVSYAKLNTLERPYVQSLAKRFGKQHLRDNGGRYLNEEMIRSNISSNNNNHNNHNNHNHKNNSNKNKNTINTTKITTNTNNKHKHKQKHVRSKFQRPVKRAADNNKKYEKFEAFVEEIEHGKACIHKPLDKFDQALKVKMRQQRQANEVDVSVQSLFLGSNLFSTLRRTCFTQEDIVLLQTRRDFELVVPKHFPSHLLSDHKICMVMKYFNKVHTIVSKISDPDAQFDGMRSLYDTLGGYLRHRLLPVARLSFYAGRLRLCTVDRLMQMYSECRISLNTNGNGWRRPPRDLLTRMLIDEVVPLTKMSYKTTEPGACTLLDLHSISRDASNMQMLVSLPRLDDENDEDLLMNIALPFKRRRIYNLRSSNSAFILVRFYLIVSRCYETTGMCQEAYNDRFKQWINDNLESHLNDEVFYPGLGGILRIYENLRRTKKSTENKSLSSKFMNIVNGGLNSKDFVVDDGGQFDDDNIELEDDEAEREGWDERKETTAADDDDDDDEDDEFENDDDEHVVGLERKRKRERKRIKAMERNEQHRCDVNGARAGSANHDDKHDNYKKKHRKEPHNEHRHSKHPDGAHNNRNGSHDDHHHPKSSNNYVPYMFAMLVLLLMLLFGITMCSVYRKNANMPCSTTRGGQPYRVCPSAMGAGNANQTNQRRQRSSGTPAPASQTSPAARQRARQRQRQREQTDSEDCCQNCYSTGPRKKKPSSGDSTQCSGKSSSQSSKNCDEVIELKPGSRSVQPTTKSAESRSRSRQAPARGAPRRGAPSRRSPVRDAGRRSGRSGRSGSRRVHYSKQSLLSSDESHSHDIDIERQLDSDQNDTSSTSYESKSRLRYPPPRQISIYTRLLKQSMASEDTSGPSSGTEDNNSSGTHQSRRQVGFNKSVRSTGGSHAHRHAAVKKSVSKDIFGRSIDRSEVHKHSNIFTRFFR